MLIHLPPEFLEKQAFDKLLRFLRHPFSDDSCRYLSQRIPALEACYRTAADQSDWGFSRFESLAAQPSSVFRPLPLSDRIAVPAPLIERLLAANTLLLEEELRDALDRRREPGGKDSATPAATQAEVALALRGLSLHEAAFLTIVGVFEVHVKKGDVRFELTSSGADSLWNRVRSTSLDMFSSAATRHQLAELAAKSHSRRPRARQAGSVVDGLDARDLDELASRLLDANFALSRRMQADSQVRPMIEEARQLCRWIALLAVARTAGEQEVTPTPRMLKRLALDIVLPNKIITALEGELQSNQGIYRTTRGDLSLGSLVSVEHALNSCKRVVLEDRVATELGKHFESHIKLYVSDGVPPEDYIVLEGFPPSGKHQGEGYDCDLIIYEPRRRKVFFVQSKWTRESRTANLEDEMRLWRKKNFALVHGVGQLCGLRKRLREKEILAKAKNRLHGLGLSDEEIIGNASYIVVHTHPFFSAYESDGIAIYEWNLFRNALLRGMTQGRYARGPLRGLVVSKQNSQLLEIEKPEQVVDFFAATVGADPNAFPALRAMRTGARYGFEVESRSPRRWLHLFGRGGFTVSRPYS